MTDPSALQQNIRRVLEALLRRGDAAQAGDLARDHGGLSGRCLQRPPDASDLPLRWPRRLPPRGVRRRVGSSHRRTKKKPARRRPARARRRRRPPSTRSFRRTRAMRSGSSWSYSRWSRCSALWFDGAGPVGDFLGWAFRGAWGVAAITFPADRDLLGDLAAPRHGARGAGPDVHRVLGARSRRSWGCCRCSAAIPPRPTATTRLPTPAGSIGALVAHPLASVISPIGAAIVCLGFAMLGALIFTGTPIATVWATTPRLLHGGRRVGGTRDAAGARRRTGPDRVRRPPSPPPRRSACATSRRRSGSRSPRATRS